TPFTNQSVPSALIKGPGKYYVRVEDSTGEMALDSIVVDSINPVADFELISNDFYITSPNEAYDKAKVKINNLAPPLFLEPTPPFDTLYYWTIKNNLNQTAKYHTYRPDQGIDTIFNNLGVHEICLDTRNYNNCRDTLCKEISVVSSMIKDSNTPIIVVPDYQSQTVQFHSKDFTENHIVNIFSIDGKLVRTANLNSPIQTVNFTQAKGVYVFSITLNNNLESSGKFVFGY
ncbi:MAG: T9SS type A sorting domain-containing protein, partial [Crocinitomicaceae bacterium]